MTGLALGGFAMSYGALHALARDSAVPAYLAWLWPLVVDGFIVVASLSVLHAVLEARPCRYPWLLLLVFSAVSVAGNVAHGSPTLVGRLVAAVPPVALVLAFDLLMRQVRLTFELPRHQMTASSTKPVEATERSTTAAALRLADDTVTPRPIDSPRAGRRSVTGQAARLVARARASGQPVTGRWLAGQLGISDGYARRLLRRLEIDRAGPHGARESGVMASR